MTLRGSGMEISCARSPGGPRGCAPSAGQAYRDHLGSSGAGRGMRQAQLIILNEMRVLPYLSRNVVDEGGCAD